MLWAMPYGTCSLTWEGGVLGEDFARPISCSGRCHMELFRQLGRAGCLGRILQGQSTDLFRGFTGLGWKSIGFSLVLEAFDRKVT